MRLEKLRPEDMAPTDVANAVLAEYGAGAGAGGAGAGRGGRDEAIHSLKELLDACVETKICAPLDQEPMLPLVAWLSVLDTRSRTNGIMQDTRE